MFLRSVMYVTCQSSERVTEPLWKMIRNKKINKQTKNSQRFASAFYLFFFIFYFSPYTVGAPERRDFRREREWKREKRRVHSIDVVCVRCDRFWNEFEFTCYSSTHTPIFLFRQIHDNGFVYAISVSNSILFMFSLYTNDTWAWSERWFSVGLLDSSPYIIFYRQSAKLTKWRFNINNEKRKFG